MSGKSKEKDEKTRKTEIHDIIKQQLFDYVKDNKITQEELARRLGVSTSTISRWHNGQTSTPPVYQLPKVARLLGTTVDGLLSGKKIAVRDDLCSTYSQALLAIIELSDKLLIPPASDDPFLNWLLYQKLEVSNMKMVSDEKKAAWLDKVLVDYNKPLLSVYLTQFIELFKYVYKEITEYDTYLSVFNLFQGYEDGATRDEIDSLIKRWHDSIANETGEFKHLTIPHGGGDMMFDIDENGKVRTVEKPRYVEAVPDESFEVDPDSLPSLFEQI